MAAVCAAGPEPMTAKLSISLEPGSSPSYSLTTLLCMALFPPLCRRSGLLSFVPLDTVGEKLLKETAAATGKDERRVERRKTEKENSLAVEGS